MSNRKFNKGAQTNPNYKPGTIRNPIKKQSKTIKNVASENRPAKVPIKAGKTIIRKRKRKEKFNKTWSPSKKDPMRPIETGTTREDMLQREAARNRKKPRIIHRSELKK